jgi:signal transduction histidine kinase
MLAFVRKKLSRIMLTTLSILVSLIMLSITLFTALHQRNDMIEEMVLFGDELGHAIHGGIRYAMSVGDSAAVQQQLLDMRDTLADTEIVIHDHAQKITYASDQAQIGSHIADLVTTPSLPADLDNLMKAGVLGDLTVEEDAADGSYLVTSHLIANQEQCHGCHSPSRAVLGGILVKMSTERTYATIFRLRNRNLFIVLLGIVAVIGSTYAMLSRLVTRPITVLAEDMKRLPESISRGTVSIQTDVDRTDEIGSLLVTFNQMAVELQQKSDMITRANADLVTANKELEGFAYSVSHDLRAPLRNIDGFSKILMDEYAPQLDETAKRYLNRVRHGTTKMGMLIDDILAFSRAGRVEIQRRPMDLNALVNKAVRDFAEEITSRNVSVNVAELPSIECDPTLMHNVFSNLLSNAIKYSRERAQPEVTVGFSETFDAIYVRDNGIGFDMKYHDRIFQVFQRLHLPEEYEGTGIGLALVQRIIERHGGTIWAESKPGAGTTFYVRVTPISEGGTRHDRRSENHSAC